MEGRPPLDPASPYQRIPLEPHELNGEPLPAEHGYPARLLVPGFYGTNSVTWLGRMELASERAPGPFTTRFYNDRIAGVLTPVWRVAREGRPQRPARRRRGGGELPVGRQASALGASTRPRSGATGSRT
jgi:hypothetical protein